MSLTNLQTAAGARREASFHCYLFHLLFLSFDCPPAPQPLNIPTEADLFLSKVVARNVGHDWRRRRQRWRLSVRVLVWLLNAALRLSATRWYRFGFQVEYDSQDHVEHCADQILQIDDAADCAGSMDLSCMKCDKRVSVADNLYPYSLHSMIEVSAKAWQAILYLVTVTPWQHPPRLGMTFYILSRLGSIRRGLASYSISYHALAASAEAWHAILEQSRTAKAQAPKPELQKLKLNKQRHADVTEWEIPCEHAEEVVDFASGRGYSIGQRGKFAKNSCQKFRKNNIVYAAPTGIRIDFTSMNSHVKSYALKYRISGNFFSQSSLKVKNKAATLGKF